MHHYLVVDLGTGNSRVGLVNENGNILAVKTFENVYYIDEAYEDAQYFTPSYWKRKILALCKAIIQEHPSVHIDGISSSGARETIVLIDHEGSDFYGLPNIDNRGRKWISDIGDMESSSISKKEIYKMTGRWVTEDFPAAKLLGLKKIRNDIYHQVHTFTSLSEWIGYVMTDEVAIEPSQACETQLYDIGKKEWSRDIIREFGLEDIKMPEVISGGTRLGHISENMKTYFKIDYDVPFIVGGADTQVAVMGAGIKKGDIGIVSGTTSPVVTITEENYYDERERCWTDCYIGGDLFQVETNPGVTGLNYQRIRTLLFDSVSYEDLEEALREVKQIKCTASFSSLDFERARSYKEGGFFMRPPFRADLHRIDMAWAVVGDIACSIYYQYLQLKSMISIEPPYILGCGGGFQSQMLCQHLADLTGKPIRLPVGFYQASIIGCMRLCNIYYHIKKDITDVSYHVYNPQKNKLIHQYYDVWKQHREQINNIL